MADDFDYDELIRLMESAPPPTAVICRDRESAYALVRWMDENWSEAEDEDVDG